MNDLKTKKNCVMVVGFDWDRIDWDEERFPADGPYAGKTYKEVAESDPGFMKWYAENVPSRFQRDLTNQAIRELCQ